MDTVTTPDGLEVVEFDLTDYLEGGLLRETSFRSSMDSIDWKMYTKKDVLVRACGTGPLPPWAFMLVTAQLSQYANSIHYGRVQEPYLVYQRGEN